MLTLPPEFESPHVFVSGDLPTIWIRPENGECSPVSSPAHSAKHASGASASVPAGKCFHISHAPCPYPPRLSRYTVGSIVWTSCVFAVRSTNSTRPKNPLCTAASASPMRRSVSPRFAGGLRELCQLFTAPRVLLAAELLALTSGIEIHNDPQAQRAVLGLAEAERGSRRVLVGIGERALGGRFVLAVERIRDLVVAAELALHRVQVGRLADLARADDALVVLRGRVDSPLEHDEAVVPVNHAVDRPLRSVHLGEPRVRADLRRHRRLGSRDRGREQQRTGESHAACNQ